MIDPSTINFTTLPSLPLNQRSQLPTDSCIYFALSAEGKVLYIGKSDNLAKRWRQHHRCQQLEAMDGVRLAWLQVEDKESLLSIEAAMIKHFQPSLNIHRIFSSIKRQLGTSSGSSTYTSIKRQVIKNDAYSSQGYEYCLEK